MIDEKLILEYARSAHRAYSNHKHDECDDIYDAIKSNDTSLERYDKAWWISNYQKACQKLRELASICGQMDEIILWLRILMDLCYSKNSKLESETKSYNTKLENEIAKAREQIKKEFCVKADYFESHLKSFIESQTQISNLERHLDADHCGYLVLSSEEYIDDGMKCWRTILQSPYSFTLSPETAREVIEEDLKTVFDRLEILDEENRTSVYDIRLYGNGRTKYWEAKIIHSCRPYIPADMLPRSEKNKRKTKGETA